MRHRNLKRKLNRTSAHRHALMCNLAEALLHIGKIKTTVVKAKALRPFVEKLVTLGKRGDLHARRLAARCIDRPPVLQKLFDHWAPMMAQRPGGYTRIIRQGIRRGDCTEMALIEMVGAYEPRVKVTPEPSEASEPLLATSSSLDDAEPISGQSPDSGLGSTTPSEA